MDGTLREMEENHIMEKRKDREDQSMYWKKACKLTAVLGLAVMLEREAIILKRNMRGFLWQIWNGSCSMKRHCGKRRMR